jgi:hypothetical protein
MREIPDIAPTHGLDEVDRLRQLTSQGRLTMPTRERPTRAPRLVKTDRSASSLVLAERGPHVLPESLD